MPWKEITQVEQRRSFIHAVFLRRKTMAQLCAEFQISEKTGYKWVRRYLREGDQSLEDRSHAPHTIPHRMPAETAGYFIALRGQHPTWGPRKLAAYAAAHNEARRWPAASSIGALLKQAGLVRQRRFRKAANTGTGWGLTRPEAPNAVWSADFKGEFRLGSGPYCYPLTVLDAFSRYLLGCRALESTQTRDTLAVFRQLFRDHGLPAVIRTDNGAPFGSSSAIARLSPLAVWWIRLGIRPERITPGHPQQNGAHERLHRTLKAETARPASSTWRGQQRRFDRFRESYNFERPHEALDLRPPSIRSLAARVPFALTATRVCQWHGCAARDEHRTSVLARNVLFPQLLTRRSVRRHRASHRAPLDRSLWPPHTRTHQRYHVRV